MSGLRIGSLCSGYGGLESGLQQVVGGEVAWHVENDPAPSKILAHHWPDVPNYGDIKTVDWTRVEPVEWLTAGYPCQPFSHAGKRKGTDDERHIWPYVAAAIRSLRPRHVLLENVAGHLTMGFDVVLADLAALGFDATWGVVRASDAGAPHGRARIFVLAHAASDQGRVGHRDGVPTSDTTGSGRRAEGQQRGLGAAERVSDFAGDAESHNQWHDGESGSGGQRGDAEPTGSASGAAADPRSEGRRRARGAVGSRTQGAGASSGSARSSRRHHGLGGLLADCCFAATDSPCDGWNERRTEPTRVIGGPDVAERGPAIPDPDNRTDNGERPRTESRTGGAVIPDADLNGLPFVGRERPDERDPDRCGSADIAWGDYEPAIRRWEVRHRTTRATAN